MSSIEGILEKCEKEIAELKKKYCKLGERIYITLEKPEKKSEDNEFMKEIKLPKAYLDELERISKKIKIMIEIG